MAALTIPRTETRVGTCTRAGGMLASAESIDTSIFDDVFDGLIPFSDEDDRGGNNESCDDLYGECDETARYYVTYADSQGKQDCCGKLYFCPRHYAQYLHYILDSMRANNDMNDLDDSGTWFAIRAYVTGYGPISNR